MAPGARRAALLAHLRERGGAMSTDEIAAEIGLHPNTVRAHLDVLSREGKVERVTEHRTSRGRPRELFSVTGAPEPEESYAQLAALLASQLESLDVEPRAQAIEAGKRWAATELTADSANGSATAEDEVLGVLRRNGFEPQLAADGATILLHRCPFGAVASSHTDVVCGAHLGLIQGTLDRVAPGSRAQLTPFVAPGLCESHLELVTRLEARR